jgi:hypothetical protein
MIGQRDRVSGSNAFSIRAQVLRRLESRLVAMGAGSRLPLGAQPRRDHLDRGHRRSDVRPRRQHWRALDNLVLRTEGRVTVVDGILATAVLAGLGLNATLGWRWADPAAGCVLVFYAAREARAIITGPH